MSEKIVIVGSLFKFYIDDAMIIKKEKKDFLYWVMKVVQEIWSIKKKLIEKKNILVLIHTISKIEFDVDCRDGRFVRSLNTVCWCQNSNWRDIESLSKTKLYQ